MEISRCKYYELCGLQADTDHDEALCILHSKNPDKNEDTFNRELERHRRERGDDFFYFVFPKSIDFSGTVFSNGVNFNDATFSGEANFNGAKFTDEASFCRVRFSDNAYFVGAQFSKEAIFLSSKFYRRAHFGEALFSNRADFRSAEFSGNAGFWGTRFEGNVTFRNATFLERTTFVGRQDEKQITKIFAGVEVEFRNVTINPPDALIFRDADLGKCLFMGTRLRSIELTNVNFHRERRWPFRTKHLLVYDDVALSERIKTANKTEKQSMKEENPWVHIETIYRDLKKNFEDAGEHERAGGFHYCEKEMRRRNPDTSWTVLRFLLRLYWLISAYGEGYIRPLGWFTGLLLAGTASYLFLGISFQGAKLSSASFSDWLCALHYSLQVMTLLSPEEWSLQGHAHVVRTVQSLLGPVLLGFFALAARQRLRR